MLRQFLSAIAVLCAVTLQSAAASAADITITVEGLRNNQGEVLLCLFSAEASKVDVFPDCEQGKPVRSGKAVIGAGKVVVTYYGLKDGAYAVAAIHDENKNGKLDTNFVGLPTEGVGISNNPTLYGKPKFPEAKFDVSGNKSITITAKYIL